MIISLHLKPGGKLIAITKIHGNRDSFPFIWEDAKGRIYCAHFLKGIGNNAFAYKGQKTIIGAAWGKEAADSYARLMWTKKDWRTFLTVMDMAKVVVAGASVHPFSKDQLNAAISVSDLSGVIISKIEPSLGLVKVSMPSTEPEQLTLPENKEVTTAIDALSVKLANLNKDLNKDLRND